MVVQKVFHDAGDKKFEYKEGQEMKDDKVTVEIVSGREGKCICINDYRVAGPKPWGGGRVEKRWTVDKAEILKAVGYKIGLDSNN